MAQRDPIGGAEMRGAASHNVDDAESSPPHPPRRSRETRALRDLSRGCKTESKVESTSSVCALATISLGEDVPAQGLHSKRLSFFKRRWNEEGCNPTTPGNN